MESLAINIFFSGETSIEAHINGMQISTGMDGVPSPFDLFLLGIGTCTGAKVLSFCQERNISTQNLCVKQHIFYNPESRMVETIKFDIQLPPDFPEHYQEALVRAANTCGVKRHLFNPPDIHIQTSFVQTLHSE